MKTTPVSIEDMAGHYKRSKWLAEQVALEKARAGLPVVIVNPTAPIGDHDWKPDADWQNHCRFLKRQFAGFVDTGLNLVDVRDIALGHLLAAEKGKAGERYILGRKPYAAQILDRLSEVSGKPAPRIKVPYAIAYATGVISTTVAHFTGKYPFAPLEGVRMARKSMFVSHAKAARELGFMPGSVDGALARAVAWFQIMDMFYQRQRADLWLFSL